MEKENKNNPFDTLHLLFFLWKKRTPIIIVTLLAAIVSIIVSLSIDDKYKSEVIVFPTSGGSISDDLLATKLIKKEIMKLGEDEEVEQLLQVLKSDNIRNRIIEKFDLIHHYEIDATEKYKQTALYKKFDKNIAIEPTKFMSVKIRVLDKNSQTAADIANEICNLIDTVMNNMRKERALEALNLVEREYFSLKNNMRKLEDSLVKIKNEGIGLENELEIKKLKQSYEKQIEVGNEKKAQDIQKKIGRLNKNTESYASIRDYLKFEQEHLANLTSKYAEAKLEVNQNLPNKYIVNAAYPAEKKSYPIRWLIVVVATASTFLIAILLLLLIDKLATRISEIKQEK